MKNGVKFILLLCGIDNVNLFQPLLQEYHEFSPKIDELNDIGNAYDAIQSGDSRPKSPMRFSKLCSTIERFLLCFI